MTTVRERSGTTDTELWGPLGFVRFGALDYTVPQFEADWLVEAARRLEAGETLGPMQYNVAMCLRQLAETASALKALNHHSKHAPGSLSGLNIALHLAACSELHGRKRALAHVAEVWDRKENAVEDYRTDHAAAAKAHLEHMVELKRPHGLDRTTVLQQIDAAMCDKRRSLAWFKRKKKTAARRRR